MIGLRTRPWSEDPPWASVYDFLVEHPLVGVPVWALGAGTDLRLLYAATAEIGELPAGSRVLDIPSGGGVALRGVRPGQGLAYVAADIAPTMLGRVRRSAQRRGVDDQLTTRVADVGRLPFADGDIDFVASFTGLHCFPDPERAVAEMARVLRSGGVLSGSSILDDTGLRFEPLRIGGRMGGLLGPGCTSSELHRWLTRHGLVDVTLRTSGAVGYFRAVKG